MHIYAPRFSILGTLPAHLRALRFIGGFVHYKKTVLGNGITVLSERMESVRSVSLGVWFQVGSRDESPKEAGLSHFNEHMMFKGTPTRSALKISKEFDWFGARQNAFTSREATCYYADFLDESLDGVFELIADMVKNSLFEQSNCDTEREVVIEEISRSKDDPEDSVYELFSTSQLPNSTLGLPIAGTVESVSKFGQAEAQAFHDKHYHGRNCFVVACGNLSHDHLVELAVKHLSEIEDRGVGNSSLRKAPETIASGSFFETKPIEQTHILMGTQSVSARDSSRYAHSVANYILGGGMGSRLFQEIREKLGLVYTVYSMTQHFSDLGVFCMYAGTRPENAEQVIEVAKRELNKLAEEGCSDDELQLAKNAIKGSLALQVESTSNRMRTLGNSYMLTGHARSFDELLGIYSGITAADVQSAIATLASAPITLAQVGPDKSV